MKSDRSDGRGLVDRGPRVETTLDMSQGRLAHLDPGARLAHRKLTRAERAWINSSTVPIDDTDLPNNDALEEES